MQKINSLSSLKTQLLPFTRALLSQHLNKHMSHLKLYYPFKIDFWHLFLQNQKYHSFPPSFSLKHICQESWLA